MELLFIAIVAGILTVLSPCVLPVLPVVLGGSLGSRSLQTPLTIIGALSVSVILFTLLLRASTVFITIPPSTWYVVAGGLVILIGAFTAFPSLWEKISLKFNLLGKTSRLVSKSNLRQGTSRNVLLGFSLGPVFTSCSPTYGLILAAVLPVNFITGFIYLIVYTIGLAAVMLLIAFAGQKTLTRLTKLSDPNSRYRRGLGIILIIVGIAIATGWIKDVETLLIDSGYDATRLENNLLR